MLKTKEWFESWFNSPYYPLLYDHRDFTEAQSFVSSLMNYLKPPPDSKLLDIACGEGRFSIQLSRYGQKVVGIDLSEERIQIAQEKANDKTEFFVHDMRFPFYINYFDYAFNFFTSFGYFDLRRDHLMAAKSFAAALNRNGILIIDYFNNDYVKKNLVHEETIIKNGVKFEIKRHISDKKIIKEIYVIDSDGQRQHYMERVSDVGIVEFEKLFKEAGMELLHTFGNYALDGFDAQASPRLIMIYKKANVK